MTKDEFKLLITKQFKQEDAPIHKLMLSDEPTDLADAQNHPYQASCRFYASEFNLTFHVQCIEGKDGKPVFQICFQDLPRNIQLPESERKFDLSSNELLKINYLVETIKFSQNALDFAVDKFLLTHSNYEFACQREEDSIAKYEVKKEAFNTHCIPAILGDRLLRWSTPEERYVQYVYDAQQAEQFHQWLKTNEIPTQRGREIEETLRKAQSSTNATSLVDVIQRLYAYSRTRFAEIVTG